VFTEPPPKNDKGDTNTDTKTAGRSHKPTSIFSPPKYENQAKNSVPASQEIYYIEATRLILPRKTFDLHTKKHITYTNTLSEKNTDSLY
jgi:hypothetical protein